MNRFGRQLCLFLLFASSFAWAQTGLYSFGSFDSKGFDSINLGNLNTHFAIPIVNKQGRGLSFNYSIDYEGLVWSPAAVSGGTYWQGDPNWGFHGQLNEGFEGYMSFGTLAIKCHDPDSEVPGSWYWGSRRTAYAYHDQFGVQHRFVGYMELDCNGVTASGTGNTVDGSGLRFDGVSVITRGGAKMQVPLNNQAGSGTLTDTNGNQIVNHGNGTFTDTLGVTALTITGGGTASSPRVFSYPVTLQSNGATTASAIVTYTTYTVQTNFQCSGIGEYGATQVDLMNRITLADGSFYQFSYEPTPGVGGAVTGRLASVTLPTGGTISYAYSGGCNNSGMNADGTPATLTRTTSDGAKTYSRVIVGTTSTTNVADEKQNHGVYTFVGDTDGFWYETERKIYQGAASGTPLQDRITQYNGQTSSSQAPGAITQTDVLESFNGLSQTKVENQYNTAGLVTLTQQMDPANSNAVLLSTATTYNSVGKVLSSTTSAPGGAVIASSSYGYDESSPTGTSGILQHVAGASVRGNQTSTHTSTGSGTIDTSTIYYDTGVPVSTTTPNGTTSFSYDATQAFATTTTLPTPSSGVSLATSASYDSQSGVLLSSTGFNTGQTIQVTQYDRLLNPLLISLPNGGQIRNDPESPNQVGVRRTMGNGVESETEPLTDGYGRKSRVAIYNGQAGSPWYQTDYCYDAAGLLQFQSVQYQGGGWGTPKQCSGNGTSYAYDALGRLTSATNPEGVTTHQYNGRAEKISDVNGVQKITQYDLLGRISKVCEISSHTQGTDSPGNCGLDIAGTGFLTNYTYDLVNHKTTIAQGVQSRTFATDAAGRTVSTTEPERGTTSYSYSYNATGLQIVRTRPRANQTNPAVLTTTTTQYDSLGREVSTTYNDGTPTRTFSYDQANAWGGSTLSLGASKGQLTEYYSQTSPQPTFGFYMYDIMGQIVRMDECLPAGCGSGANERVLGYSYDLAGNLIGQSDGATGSISYGRSPAGEVTSITNQSYTDAYNTPNLVSNVVNGPGGPISYTLGNGLNFFRAYDWANRPFAQWICTGPAQFNCNTQLYGTDAYRSGARVTDIDDTILAGTGHYGYDEFNRLTSATRSSSNLGNFTYSYDRYGNRLSQTVTSGSGPQPSFAFDQSTNRINGSGVSYDAAGNVATDGIHSYQYDAEGNLLTVDNGNTAQYIYDSLNRRVHEQTANTSFEYTFDFGGKRISRWNVLLNSFGDEGKIYWDGRPIAIRAFNGQTFFEHQDILGTERMRTNYQGQVAERDYSLPFGDGFSTNILLSYADQDNRHFALLDHDASSNTDHAQFRQYSPTQGRWMSPDPSSDSYRVNNPQTFNRYTYARNNPLLRIDPQGLSDCESGFGGLPGGEWCNQPDPCYGCTTASPSDPCPANTCVSVTVPNDPFVPYYPGDGFTGQSGDPTGGGGGGNAGSSDAAPTIQRTLDPNNQECKALANKIANIVADIESSRGDLANNPLKLPLVGPPGARPSASVQGHQELLNGKMQNLANRAHEYNQKCGGGDPFGGSSPSTRPATAVSPGMKRGVLILGGVIIVGATAILCPECLLVPALAIP